MTVKFNLNFKLLYETKGAVRYMEVDDMNERLLGGYVVGALYIRKSAFNDKSWPTYLSVQIREEKE